MGAISMSAAPNFQAHLSRSMDDLVANGLERLSQTVDISEFDEDPEVFVRNLHVRWKHNIGDAGKYQGKWLHSDSYLLNILVDQNKEIKSLVPKLGGRTRIQPEDGRRFVEIFLKYWRYIGDIDKFDKKEFAQEALSVRYEPFFEDHLIKAVSDQTKMNLTQRPVRTEKAGDIRRTSFEGENTASLIARVYSEALALITVSTQQTLIVANQRLALLGFRDLVDKLWEIDKSLKVGIPCPLIWILDLGIRNIEDSEARLRFLNVEALASRFKALRLFDDPHNKDARWKWLKSKAVIILRDPNPNGSIEPLQVRPPTFNEDHMLLHTLPPSWATNPSFHKLYGEKFERLSQRNYSVFATRRESESLSEVDFALRFFGHAQPESGKGSEEEHQARGLELPSPDLKYEDAFKAVYAAAVHKLGLDNSELSLIGVDGSEAAEQLSHLRFRILNIDEFMRYHVSYTEHA